MDQRLTAARRVRDTQRDQLIQNKTEAVDVTSRVTSAGKALGGHVPQRAKNIAGVGDFRLIIQLGQAEIGDPDRAFPVEQQI